MPLKFRRQIVMSNIKSKEVEALLRSLQAGNNIPRYLCYWADGSVTHGDESPLLEAAKSRLSGLLAYLTPQGQFVKVADADIVAGEQSCVYCGHTIYAGGCPACGAPP